MNREKKSNYNAWIFIIVAMIILYPLSIAPAEWLGRNGFLNSVAISILQAFYAPLVWLGKNSEWANGLIMWYMSLWGLA